MKSGLHSTVSVNTDSLELLAKWHPSLMSSVVSNCVFKPSGETVSITLLA